MYNLLFLDGLCNKPIPFQINLSYKCKFLVFTEHTRVQIIAYYYLFS